MSWAGFSLGTQIGTTRSNRNSVHSASRTKWNADRASEFQISLHFHIYAEQVMPSQESVQKWRLEKEGEWQGR